MKLVFYTRSRCQLCDDAKVLLEMLQEDLDFTIIERDIDQSDEWTEKYGLMIPVVEVDGEVLQYGMVDPEVIESFVKQKN